MSALTDQDEYSPFGINLSHQKRLLANAQLLLGLNADEWQALCDRVVLGYPKPSTSRDTSDWECIQLLTQEMMR